MPEELSVVGKRVPLLDAREKVTGSLQFAPDISLPGMLVGKILRSPYPHARIVSIDTSKAEALPGVAAVITHKDMPQEEWQERSFNYRGRVLDDRARFTGDEIAAVAAVDEYVAEDLAKVNVASLLVVQNGVCKEARIGLGGVAPTPMRAKKAEEMLRGKQLDDGLIELAARTAADATRPITDLRSTAEYRKELSKVLVSRAIKMSWERVQGKKGG